MKTLGFLGEDIVKFVGVAVLGSSLMLFGVMGSGGSTLVNPRWEDLVTDCWSSKSCVRERWFEVGQAYGTLPVEILEDKRGQTAQ